MSRCERIYKRFYNQAATLLGDMVRPLRFCCSVNYLGSIYGEFQSALL